MDQKSFITLTPGDRSNPGSHPGEAEERGGADPVDGKSGNDDGSQSL
jgi:hypothetical protein